MISIIQLLNNVKHKVMVVYLNMKTSYGTETVDQLDKKDFKGAYSYKEFRAEKLRLINEYRLCGMNVYSSQRACSNWKN